MHGLQLIKFYLFGIVIATLSKNILADQCYSCSGDSSSPCADPFNAGGTGVNKVPLGASDDGSACMKVVTKQASGTNFLRTAGPTCPTVTCTGFNGYSRAQYFCIKDLCNSAPGLKTFKTSAIVLTILSSLISIKLFL